MRCIIQDNLWEEQRINQQRYSYFKAMSESMAYICEGRAAVMDRNIRVGRTGRIKQAGIWHKVEFPRLRSSEHHVDANGHQHIVDSIDAIGEQNQTIPDTLVWWRDWWQRTNADYWPDELLKPIGIVSKRDSPYLVDRQGMIEKPSNLTHGLFGPKEKRGMDWDTSIFDEGGRLEIPW